MCADTTESGNAFMAGECRIPLTELSFSWARSGGPGGQNVNKVETKAVLRFDFAGSPSISDELKERAKPKLAPRLTDEGELVLSSTKTRSREQNRSDCIERLAALLADAFQPVRVRKKTRPSRAQKQRRLDNKKRRGEKKKDRGQRWDE